MTSIPKSGLARRLRRLARDRSGVAYIEFVYALPVILAIGMYGIEATNLAMAHMTTSQVALSLADNASRIGQDSTLSLTQFREADANDSFAAAEHQAGRFDVVGRGRIILSSLEQNEDEGQWIHWQRCFGDGDYESSYGDQGDGQTGTDFPGMGPDGQEVKAPPNNAVMFVEVFYRYEPIVMDSLFGEPELHYTASFVVRDDRDLTRIYNPSPAATPSTC